MDPRSPGNRGWDPHPRSPANRGWDPHSRSPANRDGDRAFRALFRRVTPTPDSEVESELTWSESSVSSLEGQSTLEYPQLSVSRSRSAPAGPLPGGLHLHCRSDGVSQRAARGGLVGRAMRVSGAPALAPLSRIPDSPDGPGSSWGFAPRSRQSPGLPQIPAARITVTVYRLTPQTQGAETGFRRALRSLLPVDIRGTARGRARPVGRVRQQVAAGSAVGISARIVKKSSLPRTEN
jgi:hypothetical protein